MHRVYNFSSGPAALPLPVLEKAARQMADYEGTGMSVMEMSHRGKVYEDIHNKAQELLRELLDIPANYKVLFIQGGASTQFAMVPLNLMSNSKRADYVNTGIWSKKAITESEKYGKVNIVASGQDNGFISIPGLNKEAFDSDADYFHITHNNTVYGTKISQIPNTGSVPLIADMSSSILSEPVDVSKFGVIYAGAQKNIGPAGVTVVIIRQDLIDRKTDFGQFEIPAMLSYKTYAESNSLYNTPPTYGIYLAFLVFEWLKNLGGIAEITKINAEKARIIYDYLDNSKLFKPFIQPPHRSNMNITYTLPTKDLTERFVKEAEACGLVNLKGYRTLGGIRASIYNAMPIEGVQALVEFMKKFEVSEAHNV